MHRPPRRSTPSIPLVGFEVPVGYEFSGKWNTKADGSGDSYDAGSSITVTENLTLFAQWTKLAETVVTYNSNDKAAKDSTRIVYGDASKGIKTNTISLTTDDFANIAGSFPGTLLPTVRELPMRPAPSLP